MGEKNKQIHAALLEGATAGLVGDDLYNFIREHCPKASSKKIVRVSLMALSDPTLRDKNIINVIYALAIKYRLDGQADLEEM